MKPFLYPVLRFVLRPVIRFIRSAFVQNSYLDNERLRFKLNAIDPATLAIYGNVVIVHPERCMSAITFPSTTPIGTPKAKYTSAITCVSATM